jgi:hypothetical protein
MLQEASASFGSSKPEPVKQCLLKQHDEVRQAAWAGQYRPKKQAVHAFLLDKYGRAG